VQEELGDREAVTRFACAHRCRSKTWRAPPA
jgi:hypothetical protein